MSAHHCIGNPCRICFPRLCDSLETTRLLVTATTPPAPLLPGVSASELRFIAEEIYPEKYGDEPNCYSRAAAILRSVADAIDKGAKP